MREFATKRQKLMNETFRVPQLTMRESIIRALEHKIDPKIFKSLETKAAIDEDSDGEGDHEASNDIKRELTEIDDGKLTISDIANALGMHKEEKTMSRVLNELRKSHKQIEASA